MERFELVVDKLRLECITGDLNSQKVAFNIALSNSILINRIYADIGGRSVQLDWNKAGVQVLSEDKITEEESKDPKKLKNLKKIVESSIQEKKQDILGLLEVAKSPKEESFKPFAWEGRNLKIPIEFIRINLLFKNRSINRILADIQLGHYFRFPLVTILTRQGNGFCLADGGKILDYRISDLFNRMFQKPEVHECITKISRGEIFSEEIWNADVAEGCDIREFPEMKLD